MNELILEIIELSGKKPYEPINDQTVFQFVERQLLNLIDKLQKDKEKTEVMPWDF